LGERLQAFGWTHCRHCRAAPETVYTVAAGDYGAPLDALVQRLKYQGDLALAEALAWQMARRWQTLTDKPPLPDIFVPVPGSHRRLAQRGYNQAYLLTQRLAKRLGRPARADLLHKTRDTRSQAGLNGEQRQTNLAGAFRAGSGVAGRRLGLVDDVLTTGATLQAARTALLAGGAAHVGFWVMARTPE
jgi:ComF family protein